MHSYAFFYLCNDFEQSLSVGEEMLWDEEREVSWVQYMCKEQSVPLRSL